MKRSEINQLIKNTKEFFSAMSFQLPPWAFWGPEDWAGRAEECREIVEAMLGWDITDFGSGDIERRGLFLFALRNGRPDKDGKPYAEKIMMVNENQETPFHYHWNKMEDIINRGGGRLVLELYLADDNDSFSHNPVPVSIDGRARTVEPGTPFALSPGESITLYPRLYHRFFAEPGGGPVLTGEVSMVNDDTTDNRFKDTVGRFPEVEEDTEPLHLLISDYPAYVT